MVSLRLLACTLLVTGCSFEWDAFDPRLGEGGGGGAVSSSTSGSGASQTTAQGGGGGVLGTGGADPCAACTNGCVAGQCAVTIELVDNGDFAADLDAWVAENNAANGEDTTSLWETLSMVCSNEPSSGPSARVLHQDLVVPSHVIDASFTIAFAQDNGEALDPQNVSTIEKDPYNAGMDANENAFRIDILDPNDNVFYGTIELELYAPTDPIGSSTSLMSVTSDSAALTTLLSMNEGATLRLRIAQVESTFPWTVWLDDVSLEVLGVP